MRAKCAIFPRSCLFTLPFSPYSLSAQIKKYGGSGIQTHHGSSLNNVKCGTIYQDPTAAFTSKGSLLPSSYPVSSYCSDSYGNSTTPLFQLHLVRHLAIIDAVCRCRLGVIGALFEYTGTYVSESKATHLRDTYNYNPATGNKHARPFACREDYAVYWLLRFIQYYKPAIDGTKGTNLRDSLHSLPFYSLQVDGHIDPAEDGVNGVILYDNDQFTSLYDSLFPHGKKTSSHRIMAIARGQMSFDNTIPLPGFSVRSFLQATVGSACQDVNLFDCGNFLFDDYAVRPILSGTSPSSACSQIAPVRAVIMDFAGFFPSCFRIDFRLPILYKTSDADPTTTKTIVYINSTSAEFTTDNNVDQSGGLHMRQTSPSASAAWKDIKFDPTSTFTVDTGYTNYADVPGNDPLNTQNEDGKSYARPGTQFTARGIAIDLFDKTDWTNWIVLPDTPSATVLNVVVLFTESASTSTVQVYRIFSKIDFTDMRSGNFDNAAHNSIVWYEFELFFDLSSGTATPGTILDNLETVCKTSTITRGGSDSMHTCDTTLSTAPQFDSPTKFYWNVLVETFSLHFRLWSAYSQFSGSDDTFTRIIDEFTTDFTDLPSGGGIGDHCRASELSGERRGINVSSGDTPRGLDAHFVSSFTFYRGGIPKSLIEDFSYTGTGDRSDWPETCFDCYYDQECVPAGGFCCSGAVIPTTSSSCPEKCNGTSLECNG